MRCSALWDAVHHDVQCNMRCTAIEIQSNHASLYEVQCTVRCSTPWCAVQYEMHCNRDSEQSRITIWDAVHCEMQCSIICSTIAMQSKMVCCWTWCDTDAVQCGTLHIILHCTPYCIQWHIAIVGFFCHRALWKRRYSAKKTYDFLQYDMQCNMRCSAIETQYHMKSAVQQKCTSIERMCDLPLYVYVHESIYIASIRIALILLPVYICTYLCVDVQRALYVYVHECAVYMCVTVCMCVHMCTYVYYLSALNIYLSALNICGGYD